MVGLIPIPFLQTIYALALFLPFLGVGFRRMHDIGKPGWYYLIPAIYSIVTSFFTPAMNTEFDPETGMPLEMPDMGAVAFGGILGVIGLVIAVVFLFWLVKKSQPETNEYGPPPAEARS